MERAQRKSVKDRKKMNPGKLFVSNLPTGHDKETLTTELRKIFKPFGKIKEIEVKHRNKSIVFAFVNYEDMKSSERALQL